MLLSRVSDWFQITFTPASDWLRAGFDLVSYCVQIEILQKTCLVTEFWVEKSLVNGTLGGKNMEKIKNEYVDGQLATDKKQRRTNAHVDNRGEIETNLKPITTVPGATFAASGVSGTDGIGFR